MATLLSSFNKLFTPSVVAVTDNFVLKGDLPEPYPGHIVMTKAEDFIGQNNLSREHYEFARDFGGQSRLICDFYKPFIAGGFFRRWVEGQPFEMEDYTNAGDIDVFSAYKKHAKPEDGYLNSVFNFVKNTYDGYLETDYDENKNNKIYTDTYTFQIMNFMYHKPYNTNIYEAIIKNIESMDASINMCAYDFNNDSFVYHSEFINHVKTRNYKFNGSTRSHPRTAILRLEKFIKLGYSLDESCATDMAKFMARNIHKIEEPDMYNLS